MKRTVKKSTSMLSILAAGALLLSGCGTAVNGVAQADGNVLDSLATGSGDAETSETSETESSEPVETTETTESSETTTSVETSETSDSETPIPPVPPTDDSTEPPVETTDQAPTTLPEVPGATPATVQWASSFCTGFAEVAAFTSPDTTGMSKEETIKVVVDAYADMAAAATAASNDLATVPTPDVENGEAMATGVRKWFDDAARIYGGGSETIANGTYDSPTDLSDEIDGIESEMNAANDALGEALGDVDPAIQDVMLALPQCDTLVNGG